MSDSLDTCAIVSLLVGEPAEQARMVGKLLEEPETTHHIADLAISETVYVLETRYSSRRSDVVSMLKLFFSNYGEALNYNRALFDLVLPYYETHPALSFNDCCLAFIAELNHAEPLFTFDSKLSKQHASAKILE